MVEAVSNDPLEGDVIPYLPLENSKVEESSKNESDESTNSINILKKFIDNGGLQNEYRAILKTIYGEILTQRIFPKGWKQALSKENCLEILERIGHGITIEDLEGFYAELKSGVIESEILKHLMVPYLRMWWSSSIHELPPYWMGHFVDLFKNPLKELKVEFGLDNANFINLGATAFTHYSDQINRLQERGDLSRPEFFYATRELLAKSVSYADPKSVFDGAVIPVFSEELGRRVFYTLKGQIHESGLHAYLFVPIEKGEKLPAHLVFRGTNGHASIGRDLDPKGIGKRVFAASIDKIEALVREAKTSQIEVIGHSLGAADAQRAVALLVDPNRGFDFKEISLYAFCAPKLEIERVNQWKEDLRTLATENKHPVIRLNFAHHEQDAITWPGDSYLSGADLDFIYTNYLIVQSNSGALKTHTHHTSSFFLDGNFNFDIDGRTFELRKSFPNREIASQLQKLEEIKNSWRFWRGVKSYFVTLESKEEIEKRIEKMKAQQADISAIEKGGTQNSWIVHSGLSFVRYTVQSVVYHTFEVIRGIGNNLGAFMANRINPNASQPKIPNQTPVKHPPKQNKYTELKS